MDSAIIAATEGVTVHDGHPRVALPQVLALAIAQGVVVATVIAIGAVTADGAPGVAYLFALVSGALVVATSRVPVAALVAAIGTVIAYYVLDLPPIGVAVPILGVVYLTALAGHIAAAAACSTVLVALSAIFRVLEGGESSAVLAYDTVTNFALIAATVSLAAMQRARRAAVAQQRRLVELERLAAERRLDTERLQISRELHDSLGHRLATVAVYAGVAGEAPDDEQRSSALRHVQENTRSALEELRVAIRTIRRGFEPLPHPSAEVAVEAAAAALRHAGFTVETSIAAAVRAVPPEVHQVAVRTVQEAVTNILKHADASSIGIQLSLERDALVVRVEDDGQVDQYTAGGGIAGMRERVQQLGGSLRAEPSGEGFLVEARIPVGSPA